MPFKSCKKDLTTIFLSVSLFLSCVSIVWAARLPNMLAPEIWGFLVICFLGLLSILYIIIEYYRTLFNLFDIEMPDGRAVLRKFKFLIWMDIAMMIFNPGWFGCNSVILDFSGCFFSVLIGCIMYFYLRGKGLLFNKFISAYVVSVILKCYFSFKSTLSESGLMFNWGDVLMAFLALSSMVLFIYYARGFYLNAGSEDEEGAC